MYIIVIKKFNVFSEMCSGWQVDDPAFTPLTYLRFSTLKSWTPGVLERCFNQLHLAAGRRVIEDRMK